MTQPALVRSMIIAIDGPAGAGKSTVARELARVLGLSFLDTGAMYRAVTLVVLREGFDPEDEQRCKAVTERLQLSFDAHGRILIDGQAGEPQIRSAAVNQAVSLVARQPSVRRLIVARQRELAREWGGLVAEGRDTTTAVFPGAEHKFFLNASPAERARRRAEQEGTPERAEQIQSEIEQRDRLDRTRSDSPLIESQAATTLVTDGLDARQVVERLLALVRGGASGA